MVINGIFYAEVMKENLNISASYDCPQIHKTNTHITTFDLDIKNNYIIFAASFILFSINRKHLNKIAC